MMVTGRNDREMKAGTIVEDSRPSVINSFHGSLDRPICEIIFPLVAISRCQLLVESL